MQREPVPCGWFDVSVGFAKGRHRHQAAPFLERAAPKPLSLIVSCARNVDVGEREKMHISCNVRGNLRNFCVEFREPAATPLRAAFKTSS